MLREQISAALKAAMKNREARQVATLRLILAALKDRDIAARGKGVTTGITDDEIRLMMQNMIRQRRESIGLYEQGGRCELAEQERQEIDIIESFLPKQLGPGETETVIRGLISETGAAEIKDMGRIMAALKQRYPGQMDFAAASAVVKGLLA